MRKLSEIELLKHWLDAEISIMHAMFGFLALLLVDELWQKVALGLYIVVSLFYAIARTAIVAAQDKDFLRIPK